MARPDSIASALRSALAFSDLRPAQTHASIPVLGTYWTSRDPFRGQIVSRSRALDVLPQLLPDTWEASGPNLGPPDDESGGDFSASEGSWDPDAWDNQQGKPRPTAEKVILVADDDFDTREMLRAALDMWGYRAVVADDGVAALAETRSARPDLVLLDLLMPELDGWGVLTALRLDRQTRGLPIVVISAVSRRGLAEEVLAAGASAFLEKPFDIDVLEQVIRRFVR